MHPLEYTIGSEDVCTYIINQLKDIGYDLDEHPLYSDILNILKNKVVIIDTEEYLSMSYPED